MIERAVHALRRDVGRGEPEPAEVAVEVLLTESAAQFDDGDGLAGAVGVLGAAVGGAQLNRREAGTPDVAAGDAELRARLRTVVQPEYGDDALLQRRRDCQFADALPVG